MPDSAERGRYVPIRRESHGIELSHRLPFDISSLSVTGLVIICELDDPAPGNSRPTMSMKMTQYLRLSDESMIRLDMDRGVSSSQHGHSETVSWKRSAADVIAEVLTLVKGMMSRNPIPFRGTTMPRPHACGVSRLTPRHCVIFRTRCCCRMASPRSTNSDRRGPALRGFSRS